jgi:hypothetical protein
MAGREGAPPWDRRRPACVELLCEPTKQLNERILAAQAFSEKGVPVRAYARR